MQILPSYLSASILDHLFCPTTSRFWFLWENKWMFSEVLCSLLGNPSHNMMLLCSVGESLPRYDAFVVGGGLRRDQILCGFLGFIIEDIHVRVVELKPYDRRLTISNVIMKSNHLWWADFWGVACYIISYVSLGFRRLFVFYDGEALKVKRWTILPAALNSHSPLFDSLIFPMENGRCKGGRDWNLKHPKRSKEKNRKMKSGFTGTLPFLLFSPCEVGCDLYRGVIKSLYWAWAKFDFNWIKKIWNSNSINFFFPYSKLELGKVWMN